MHSYGSLARRGMEMASNIVVDTSSGQKEVRIPPSAMLLVMVTCLVFFALLFAASYTFGHVVVTLAMIESPESTTYVAVDSLAPLSSEDDDSAPPAYEEANGPKPIVAHAEPDLIAVKNRPVTSSLRGTVGHLRARAGNWSGFRGLPLFLIWSFVRGSIISVLVQIPGLHNYLGFGLAAVIAEVTLARWYMTWIHVVISEPSSKRWWRRMPPFRYWKKIAPAVALQATSYQIAHKLPALLTNSFGALKHFQDPNFEPGKKDLYAAMGQSLMFLGLTLALYILLTIPATVTLVRVAASMLPEEDETVVSFDRTFGGRTTPEIIGGQGKIGIVEAWRSFTHESRSRLLRLVGKVFVILVSIWILFIMVLMTEAHLVLGDKLEEMMKMFGKQMKGT